MAQNFDDEVFFDEYETIEHIVVYDSYNSVIGGDSIRFCGRRKCNGHITDFYENGNIKHKGFYKHGKLQNGYENYYENGQLERKFKVLSPVRGKQEVYYPCGTLLSEAEFYRANPIYWKDYYKSGNIEFWEEYDRRYRYLRFSKFYYTNGNLESKMELSDKKRKLYTSTEYYSNGNKKESGMIKHIPASGGYLRIGEWRTYEESGNFAGIKHYWLGREFEND